MPFSRSCRLCASCAACAHAAGAAIQTVGCRQQQCLLCWFADLLCDGLLWCAVSAGQVEVPLAGPEQQRRDGAYLLQRLASPVQTWLQQQTAEVRQEWGYGPAWEGVGMSPNCC